MKKRKKIVWKVILAVLAAALLFVIIKAGLDVIFASRIPHHFASAQEGREQLLSNTEYYNNYSENDLEFRMKKTGATLDELLTESTEGVKSFSIFEKLFVDSILAKMARKLEKSGYELPEVGEITFISCDMDTEFGSSGYTHGKEIYINSSLVTMYTLLSMDSQTKTLMEELLWHEMFHVLTRNNPEFRSDMYSLIHFTVTDSDYALPKSIREYLLSNPDVMHHDAYATFVIDGREIDCYVADISSGHFAEGADFKEIPALVPTDGSDTYYTPEQAENFDAVFGTNTTYVIDPEECMAENFSLAMTYGLDGRNNQGYQSPEIIQGIIELLQEEQ